MLYERLYVVAITTVVAVIVAWFLAGRLDPVYRAQARCFMPTNPDMLSLGSETDNLPKAPKLPTGNTEAQDSLLGVLRAADLRQTVATAIPLRSSAELEKNVSFELDKYNLLTITVYDLEPDMARKIAEEYLRSFRDKLDQSTKSDIRRKADLFVTSVDFSKKEIARLEAERSAFLQGKGTVDFSTEFQMTADRVKAYRAKVDELDAKLMALRKGLIEIERQMNARPDPANPGNFVARGHSEVANPRMDQLKAGIRGAELELTDLLQLYPEAHFNVQTKRTEIATLRSQLAEELERVQGSAEFGPDPLAEDLLRKHVDQDEQIAATSAEREEYVRLLAEAQASFALLPEYEIVLNDFTNEIAQLRQTLSDARRRLAEAQLYLGRTTSFVETAEAPALPTKPWFPNVPLILLAAALIGLVLSMTAAVAMSRAASFRQEALW